MSTPEATFRLSVASVLNSLTEALDEVDTDDLDITVTDGVLTTHFESGGTFVLSQQVPMLEIWLSANRRAWHFGQREGGWKERDTGEDLLEVLNTLYSLKLGLSVQLGS